MSAVGSAPASEPLLEAVYLLARYGSTDSMLRVAALSGGSADTEDVLAVVETHLRMEDRDPALVSGLKRLLIEDEMRRKSATKEDHHG